MRLPRALTVLALVLLSSVEIARATEPPVSGTVGLMASLQSEQLDIMVPLWAAKNVMFAPVVRFVSIGHAYSDFGIGGAFRVYSRRETVSPYFGMRGMALMNSPDIGDGWTDIVLGGMFGGDYFLGESFSLGVEAQINLSISDENSTRFGNPGGSNINTGMGAFVAVYF